jgi:hypothetical protein
MYEFTAQQVADRLDGTHATPYSAVDADDDYIVSGNGTAVMESDGEHLFGVQPNATWTGTNPFVFDLAGLTTEVLGELSGSDTTVSTDMYYRDGNIFFLGKDDWTCGGEAVIYHVVPEPGSSWLMAGGIALLARKRSRA